MSQCTSAQSERPKSAAAQSARVHPFWPVNRGRDTHYWAPPAQNRAGPIRALGSHLGCLTAKRTLGQG